MDMEAIVPAPHWRCQANCACSVHHTPTMDVDRILYLDHVKADGCLLFEEIVKMDLGVLSASGRTHRRKSRTSILVIGSRSRIVGGIANWKGVRNCLSALRTDPGTLYCKSPSPDSGSAGSCLAGLCVPENSSSG